MANPHKGEVSLEAGDITYKLSFSINAICELEEKLDMAFPAIAAALNDPEKINGRFIRTLIWASLLDHHDGVDEKTAGAITQHVPVGMVMEKIGEAFTLAFPPEKAGNGDKAAKDGEDGARPSKAKAG